MSQQTGGSGALRPLLRFQPAGLEAGEAFEAWRDIMARMFLIERAGPAAGLPRGGVSAFALGDLLANRSTFNVQRLSRDRRRIDGTPDHLVLQLYRSGGFSGEMGGGPIRIARNQIAVCDLRRPLVVQAMDSATFGVTVPLHLLGPRVVGHLPQRLDPQRERLLAVRIVMLHLRLPALTAPALPDTAADLLSAIRRLLDPSTASDVLDAPELDADLAVLAQRAITEMLGRHDLTPASIAERLRVSRATLYRVFEPLGGVMAHVWSMRLEAVRTALDQPAEHRTLAQIAADHGFRTSSHLSRSFRARYGAPPREWRAAQEAQPREEWPAGLAALNSTWERLSR